MKAIIDTHALIWAVDDPARLGSQARVIVEDSTNEILFSSGSIWELAIKIGLGKLKLSLPFQKWMNQAGPGRWPSSSLEPIFDRPSRGIQGQPG